jgi:hypothetical protein
MTTTMTKLTRITAGEYATKDGRYRAVWSQESGWRGKGLWLVYADGRLVDGFDTLGECRELLSRS